MPGKCLPSWWAAASWIEHQASFPSSGGEPFATPFIQDHCVPVSQCPTVPAPAPDDTFPPLMPREGAPKQEAAVTVVSTQQHLW